MKLSICVGFAAALLTLASPAAAANWVQAGLFDWIDTDSIARSGNVTSYVSVHAIDSPAVTGAAGRRSGVDCNTRREYWDTQGGQLTPVPDDDPDFDGYMSVSDPRFRLLCPQRAASASAKPAPRSTAPVNAVPTTPAKAAKSDLKVCKEFGPDKKARIAACTRIIESPNPGFADLVSAHANRCFARVVADEKIEAALPDCNRAVTLDPKSWDAVHTRALVYNIARNYDASIADFTTAIALDPKRIGTHSNRGNVYMRKKDLKNAIADYTAEHTLYPDEDEATFRKRLCGARAALNAELEQGLSDCDAAVRLHPKESYVYPDRALVYLRMGKLKEARADTDKALSLDKKDARALYVRALVNAREGKTMASYDDYAAAKKIAEWVPKYYEEYDLKPIVQVETAPFCPALTALVKAAGERAATKAKVDVVMPGATLCRSLDRGYGCAWDTGHDKAVAKQKALAAAATTCLTAYTRKDNDTSSGPYSVFTSANTKVVVGTSFEGHTGTYDAAAIGVVIGK